MLELNPTDYPMTEEEALVFDERLEQGQIFMLYGSEECSYEESNQWYLANVYNKAREAEKM